MLRVGFEAGTHGLEVQHPNHSATVPPPKSSEISTVELADVCALITKKVKRSTPKKFEWQPVMKLNTSREIYSTTVRLRSKHALGSRFLQDGQRSNPKCNRCQNGILTPEHAFSCNISKKVKNFGFMTLEEALKADLVATEKFIIEQQGLFRTRQSVSDCT